MRPRGAWAGTRDWQRHGEFLPEPLWPREMPCPRAALPPASKAGSCARVAYPRVVPGVSAPSDVAPARRGSLIVRAAGASEFVFIVWVRQPRERVRRNSRTFYPRYLILRPRGTRGRASVNPLGSVGTLRPTCSPRTFVYTVHSRATHLPGVLVFFFYGVRVLRRVESPGIFQDRRMRLRRSI